MGEIGIGDYETFRKKYFGNFCNDENIKETFIDKSVRLSTPNYESDVDNEINSIEKYFDVYNQYSGEKLYIRLSYFLVFIITKNIKSIKDNLMEVFDAYSKYYNLPTDFDHHVDYEFVYPNYNNMEYEVDDYFDKIIESQIVTGEDCSELREILNNVINKFFNDKNEYSDEHTYIKLANRSIDCNDGTITITYKNKDTGKTYTGKIKVENLPSYVTNHKLFETIFRFKKNIL